MARHDPVIDHVEVLAAEGAALISAVRARPRGPPPSPTCPGWDVTGAGGAHRHDLALVGTDRQRATVRRLPKVDMPIQGSRPTRPSGGSRDGLVEAARRAAQLPAGRAGLGIRAAAAHGAILATAAGDGDGRAPGRRGTGHRRRLPRVDPAVAADGISEFVDVLLGRMHRGQDPPPGQLVRERERHRRRLVDGRPVRGSRHPVGPGRGSASGAVGPSRRSRRVEVRWRPSRSSPAGGRSAHRRRDRARVIHRFSAAASQAPASAAIVSGARTSRPCTDDESLEQPMAGETYLTLVRKPHLRRRSRA